MVCFLFRRIFSIGISIIENSVNKTRSEVTEFFVDEMNALILPVLQRPPRCHIKKHDQIQISNRKIHYPTNSKC